MKDEIIKLYSEGNTYEQISKLLNCSKSTISYHLKEKTRIKTKERQDKRRENKVLYKTEKFKFREFKKVCDSTNQFQKRANKVIKNFDYKDVLVKIGEKPTCYLTGRSLKLNDNNGFAFDHIIPVSKGGTNELENLGITHPDANSAKSALSLEDFIQLCKEVLEHNGYNVIKN
jgi:5-methylcytosine-specific restriction endonuclease McrA